MGLNFGVRAKASPHGGGPYLDPVASPPRDDLRIVRIEPELRSRSSRSGATYWAPDRSFTHSKHYLVNLGDSLTIICSSILHQLIDANFGVQVESRFKTLHIGYFNFLPPLTHYLLGKPADQKVPATNRSIPRLPCSSVDQNHNKQIAMPVSRRAGPATTPLYIY